MKKAYQILTILIIIINCLCIINIKNLQNGSLNAETMHKINEEVEDNVNYLKAEFQFEKTDTYQYFKYENNTLPSSKVTAFRISFDQFSVTIADYKLYCVNVDSSTTDSDLIAILKTLTPATSSCIDGFRSYGFYDGIVKLDENKKKLGIILIAGNYDFAGRIYFRITERI